MRVLAYAKINLGLHVLGRRSDGYHNIETVFRLIDMYDELEMVQADEGIHFFSKSPGLPNDTSNLCVRAANLLRDLTGTHMGVEMLLTKRIPIGGGLGGGSTDAAAALKGLTKLWSLDISQEELKTISATLGSDVPFFFTTLTGYATGRGDVVESMDLGVPYTILVVTPKLSVSTSWAYSAVKPDPSAKRPNLRTFLAENIRNGAILRTDLVNDFEKTVFQEYPEIRILKEALLSGGAELALMSGSGASVFGFFDKSAQARDLAKQLSSQYRTSVTEPQFKPDIN